MRLLQPARDLDPTLDHGGGRSSPTRRSRTARYGHLERREWPVAALLLAPALTVTAILVLYPLYQVFMTSLTDERLTAIGSGEFVGLANYTDALSSRVVRRSLVTTAVYAGAATLVSYVVGLVMAILVERFRRGKALLRGMFLVPYATTAVVVAFLFRYMLDPQVGVINYVMGRAGLLPEGTSWLTSPTLALVAVILATVWKTAPFFMIMIAAGLQGIDDEIHQAAAVDGAEGWNKFRRITFPLLLPVSAVSSLLVFIRLVNAFPIVWSMTQGGPVTATNITVIEVYRQAFREFSLGSASALGFIWLIIVMLVAVVYLRISKRAGTKGI